jgi:LysM repeat protein
MKGWHMKRLFWGVIIIFVSFYPVIILAQEVGGESNSSGQLSESVPEKQEGVAPDQLQKEKTEGTVLGLKTEEGFRIYTVQKGDTLWDITHNILKEPFLWPKVWAFNPDIKNPDLIYPGQRIKIPLFALRPELVSKEPEIKAEEVEALKEKKVEAKIEAEPQEVKKEEAIKGEGEKVALKPSIEVIEEKRPEYLIDRNLLIASGYISRSIPDRGRIIGTPQGRTTMGKGDYIYIKTERETKIGDRFYAIRSAGMIRHPERGNEVGYLIEINGIIEVVGEESGMTKAEIKESFKEINVEDRLDNFYLIEPPLKPESPATPEIEASIVAIRHLYTTTGSIYDIVYIDKGEKDGITQGSLLYLYSKEKPVVPLGIAQVINVKDETATAVLRKGLKEILVGDRVINKR